MHLFWKVLAIIYGFTFIEYTIFGWWGAYATPYGPWMGWTWLISPIIFPILVYFGWFIAIPYFAVALTLLYLWEKRKQKIKEGS